MPANVLNSMHIEELGETVPPPSHNIVGVCHQVTILILHYITSRLVPILKVIDAPIQVPNVLDLTVSLKLLNFISQLCLLFVPEMSANFTSYIIQNIYIVCLGSRIQCCLAHFIRSKKYLNILHQTKLYSVSIRAKPDSLSLWYLYSL